MTNSNFRQLQFVASTTVAPQYQEPQTWTGNYADCDLTVTASASGKVSLTVNARLASANCAYAISDLKIYGCAVPDVGSDLPVDVIADGESCTLYAYGLANYSGEYIWYRSASSL